MAMESRLLELSQIISEQTKFVHDYLAQNNVPLPSFAPNAPDQLPVELAKSQDAIVNATNELRDLVLPARDLLFHYGSTLSVEKHNNMVSLQAICRYDIPLKVPLEGEGISYARLALLLGLPEDKIRRLLRHAMTMRVFSEKKLDLVTHTPASRALMKPQLLGWLGTGADELWPGSTKVVDALAKWPGSEEPNHSGFALANASTESFYNILATNPARAAKFGYAMEGYTTTPEMSLTHLTTYYLWKDIETVVDVGGSTGQVAVALAARYPHLRLTVEDLPSAIAGHEQKIPSSLLKRITFVEHDFFADGSGQPVTGADAYIFRWILHNWPDKYAVRILQSLIPALKVGAKILIVDMIMPEPGTISLRKEAEMRAMDISMLTILNAEERSLDKWRRLVGTADPRFQISKVTEPEGSALGIIELTWGSGVTSRT